ncbi:MAG: hypothetical protein JWP35_2939 [Caulobacter sp.]|nr:hypothetical protein [Caulobacter sp.]
MLNIELAVTVTILALLRGGRTERFVAFLFLARGVFDRLGGLIQTRHGGGPPHDLAYAIVQIVLLAALAWMALRRPVPWLLALIGLQALRAAALVAVVAAPGLHPALRGLLETTAGLTNILASLCLAAAVAGRWMGAPVAPPGPGSGSGRAAGAGRDPDLYETAHGRWMARS